MTTNNIRTRARLTAADGFTPTKPGKLPVADDAGNLFTVKVTGGDATYADLRAAVTAADASECIRKTAIPGTQLDGKTRNYTRPGLVSGAFLNDIMPLPDGSMPSLEIIDPPADDTAAQDASAQPPANNNRVNGRKPARV